MHFHKVCYNISFSSYYYIFDIKDLSILLFLYFTSQNSTNETHLKILGDILLENVNCFSGKKYRLIKKVLLIIRCI